MFNTLNKQYNYNSFAVAENYKKNSDNFFSASQKPKKQYKTMNQLLKECPLLGSSQHGLNFIA